MTELQLAERKDQNPGIDCTGRRMYRGVVEAEKSIAQINFDKSAGCSGKTIEAEDCARIRPALWAFSRYLARREVGCRDGLASQRGISVDCGDVRLEFRKVSYVWTPMPQWMMYTEHCMVERARLFHTGYPRVVKHCCVFTTKEKIV